MATRNSSAAKTGAIDPALPQKKRARRRLVGAAVVCLLAAIVLPVVLDSEPKHPREDVQVRIPSRDTPLRDAEDGAVQGVIGSAPRLAQAQGDEDSADERLADPEADAPPPVDAPPLAGVAAAATAAGANASSAQAAGSVADAGARTASKTPAPSVSASAAPSPATRAPAVREEPRAEARPVPPADNRSGFLLQAGAFASEKSAAEQLARVRATGLKAYTEKINTSQGMRIRVRIGPFATRDAADKARATLQAAGMESALIAP